MSFGASTFSLDQPSLQTLMRLVHDGEIQLPEFQRGWVWRDEGIRSLIASVTLSYPIGAIMLLQTGGDVRFKTRPVEGAPDNGRAPEKLILDGQQRLTSMYLALRSSKPVQTRNSRDKEIQRWYYLDIKGCLSPSLDRLDAIISLPEDKVVTSDFGRKVELDLRTPELEYDNYMMPLRTAFDPSLAQGWQQGFMAHHQYEKEHIQRFMDFQREILARLQQYQVPTIELNRSTPRQAICQVFENVNTGGVALTVFELLTATFAADDGDFSLRADWEARQARFEAFSVLQSFRAADFLQAVTLLASYDKYLVDGSGVSSKRKDILNLTLETYKRCADRIEHGLIDAARLLHREKILEDRNLPYSSQLVPLAAITATLGSRFESDAVKRRLAQWFWAGVFGELYGSTTESRFALDIVQVPAWIGGGPTPRTILDCNFSPRRLVTMKSRNSAAYKGMMALLIQAGSHDLIRGDAIEVTSYGSQNIDIHHVFPVVWCSAQGLSANYYNSIINKTPLSATTNKKLGGSAPSAYLTRIEKGHVTPAHLDEYLKTHLIEPALLRRDDFPGFFADRARRMLDAIEDATGKEILGRDAADVIDIFGESLERRPEAPTSVHRLYDHYEVVTEIVGAGMSQAYKVKDLRSGQIRFLKRTLLDHSRHQDAIQREMQIYQRLQRSAAQRSLEVLDVVRDSTSIGLVTEFAEGGTLQEHVDTDPRGHLNLMEVKPIAREILLAIQELHDRDIIHRDIKPPNLLKVGDTWKLGDFGLAKNLSRLMTRRTMQQAGTPEYAPNEQFEGVEAHPSADIYAFGKVVTFMITGQTDPELITSPQWQIFITACIQEEPTLRAELPSLLEQLEHLPVA
jgi:hypothetical protein